MARRTGSVVLFVEGGGRGHGMSVALWWRLREPERRWRGLGVVDAYGSRGEQKVRCRSWGEGGVYMGRRWRAWLRLGEHSGGDGALGSCGGASGSQRGTSERVRRRGAAGSGRALGCRVVRGGIRSAAVCWIGPRGGASRADREASVGPVGSRVVPPGTGGGSPQPSKHL